MDYTDAMSALAKLLGLDTYEMPLIEANIQNPQVLQALKTYVDACDALTKADIAFAPVADAFFDHSKWHDEKDLLDWNEFRKFKHAFELATDNQTEAYNALMDLVE